MTQLNCFKDTSLTDLKTKFEGLIKNTTTIEEERQIAISLILDKYKQLHRKINVLRKSSNLTTIQLEVIKDLQEIKNKYENLIEELDTKILEYTKDREQWKEAREKEEEILKASKHDIIPISIGNKRFQVEIAFTEEEKEEGLSNRKSLDKNKGMLFVWEKPETVGMWMKDTLIPLDIIFINEDLIVISVYEGTPGKEDIMEENNVAFVLEVSQSSGIKIGDEIEFSPDNNAKMQILDENGNSQMELDGGERIFSRPNTKILIKFAKKANATNKDNDYKNLAKRAFKFLEIQDSNPEEFVTKKD